MIYLLIHIKNLNTTNFKKRPWEILILRDFYNSDRKIVALVKWDIQIMRF